MSSNIQQVLVPDVGAAENVEVIEILVKKGDKVKVEDPLITLESEKATMDLPSPFAGVVEDIKIKVGDKVSEGSLVATIKGEEKGKSEEKQTAEKKSIEETKESRRESEEKSAKLQRTTEAEKASAKVEKESEKSSSVSQEIKVPDLGGAEQVNVIEILVKPGDVIKLNDPLITMEGEKASMDLPSPMAGEISNIKVKVGDKVSEGDVVLTLKSKSAATKEKSREEVESAEKKESVPKEQTKEKEAIPAAAPKKEIESELPPVSADVHAGPGVRRLAREFGVNLNEVKGTGSKHRILKEDVQNYVKQRLQGSAAGGLPFSFPPLAKIDFNKFGETETQPLAKIKKISGKSLHRNWVSIPHVTQFEEADITEMENYRQEQKALAEKQGLRLTPLIFIMKAVVSALHKYPIFNASLDASGENLIIKKYFHIGVAVDTPNGLVVPVIRNVDKKGLFELAKELHEISIKAREKGLSITDMQGSCFTISSLGGIGGTAFTPIINAPEVAILGVSRSKMRPVYQNNGEFIPRLMLPLSLSYDHRVIDGADAARFVVYLAEMLSDVRNLLL